MRCHAEGDSLARDFMRELFCKSEAFFFLACVCEARGLGATDGENILVAKRRNRNLGMDRGGQGQRQRDGIIDTISGRGGEDFVNAVARSAFGACDEIVHVLRDERVRVLG